MFETTIRYLASMLSTYELTNEQHPALLAQATTLADKLAFAWQGVSNSLPIDDFIVIIPLPL